jgi:hypothetical protein
MKNKLILAFAVVFAVTFYTREAGAANIQLRSGAKLKGQLIDKTDEEITIQDPETRQLRVIKTIFIKDLVLDKNEQKLVEKLAKRPKWKDLKLRGKT